MLKNILQMLVGIVIFVLFCYIVVEDYADTCGEKGGTITLEVKNFQLACVVGEKVDSYKLKNLIV
jgi:hypothetical protein